MTIEGTPLSSLQSEGPFWRHEAEMILQGCPMLSPQDPLIRKVVMPIVSVNRALSEDTPTRFFTARKVAKLCQDEGWRSCLNVWIDSAERECST